jgi:hypothetical protein
MMAGSSDDDGLGTDPDDPTVIGPAAGWHPATANPSTATKAIMYVGYFIVLPLAMDVLTACRADPTQSTGGSVMSR